MKPNVLTAITMSLALAMSATLSQGQERQFPTNRPAGELNALTDQEKADGWKLLFNGVDLAGWERDETYANDKGEWTVEAGIVISEKGASHLFTTKKYKNFIASWDVCAYDVNPLKQRFGNSGVFLRGIKNGRGFPEGYEVQVDPYDIRNPTGGIYGKAPGNLLVDPVTKQWKPEAFFDVHEGKWIHQKALILDNHIIIWINGQITLDWVDTEHSFMEAGHIALQNHHPTDVVLFTNIKIKELD
ncbi:MAG: DUF1080 domain-containing protein [Candidatus Omnitrophota bacterium]|jgi:hypothetical protein|nr:MAG: DUF1080 domain-containing protein [Candidatus Omnitrophota bacterium]